MDIDIIDSGDDAVLVILADAAGDDASDRVLGLWRALVQAAPAWLIAVQPAYTSLQVVFAADVDVDVVCAFLRALEPLALVGAPRVVEVPVRYDGPDLDDVARHAGASVAEVIRRHSGVRYRVAFCGFLPGFAYLLGLDASLHMPRLSTPRASVPAGSVGIGGGQTGVYPAASPGGWRLIGRAQREFPEDWIAAGDVVVFRSVS
ncbi:MAG: allophanate hydrolase subunit 1 [Deltaproteobacteria bacterium]|nr:allophanate hydrolase subunit 1 [Deltaproteobacteria bacterium]